MVYLIFVLFKLAAQRVVIGDSKLMVENGRPNNSESRAPDSLQQFLAKQRTFASH